MKKMSWFFAVLLSLMTCTSKNDHSIADSELAKSIMQDIQRRNLAYIPLTERDDTLLHHVIAYYKRHGTSNELMEAYYLLGSTYRDLHEAPKAMEAFLQGINAADTADESCRYDLLARLYGQKSELFYRQSSYAQSADEGRKAARYAERAGDTLYLLSELWFALGTHFSFGDYTTVADGCWELLEKSKELGYYKCAAEHLNTSILANLELGRVDDAQKLMTIYEQESSDVNLETMECIFPIYYYTKGKLLLAQQRPQEAKAFFRRELSARDWNNRQAAYRGLREAFGQTDSKDSVLKYAMLQCEAVDSDYHQKVTEHLQDLQQLYSYTRTQEDNYRKELELKEQHQKALYVRWGFTIVSLVLCFLLYVVHSRYRKRVVDAELELQRAITELTEKNEEEQRRAVMEKQEQLDNLRRRTLALTKILRRQYQETPLFRHLMDEAKADRVAQQEDYEHILTILHRKDPTLMQRFLNLEPLASETEQHVFILLRFGLTKTEVAILTAHAPSSISSILNRLYEKVNKQKPVNSGKSMEWIIAL